MHTMSISETFGRRARRFLALTLIAAGLAGAATGGAQAVTYPGGVVTAQPDLIVTSFEMQGSPPQVTVKNQGKATAGPSTLNVSGLGIYEVGSLAPGVSKTFVLPSTCREGNYKATADVYNVVKESNEGNNDKSSWVLC